MGFKDLFKKKENVTENDINVTEDNGESVAETSSEEFADSSVEEKVKEAAERVQAKQKRAEEASMEQLTQEVLQGVMPGAVPPQGRPQEPVMVKQIPLERREELGAIVFKDKFEESDLDPLTIQEVIYVLVSVDHFNEESGVENYEQKCEMIDQILGKKLREAEVLYMTFDAATNFPFISQGCVEIYSEVEYAQEAVLHYREQYRNLSICEMRKDDTRLPENMSLFEFLHLLGMENILIDNGRFKTVIERQVVLPLEEDDEKPILEKPVKNPALRHAIIEFFQEARWPVTYEERDQVLSQKEETMLDELKNATLLVPMMFEGEEVQGEKNQVVPQEGKNMMLPKLETEDHICFTPLFTDWTEFIKIYPKDKWNGMIISFADAMRISQDMGVVINPAGENLIMNQQSFEALRQREENKEKAE